MLRRIIPVIILAAFLTPLPIIFSQSCIRNELLAAIEELEHRNHPVVSTPLNQSGSISCVQLNSTIQEVRSELQEKIQNIKEELQGVQENINDNLEDKLQGIQQLLSTILSLHYNPGYSPSHPAHSCKEIYDRNNSSPSGYYWLESSSEPVQAYCDMERTCGGVEGGWMKVININMSNSSSSCPSGLKTLTSPKRLCGLNINGGGCSSAYLDVQGVEYSRVCGKIIGYQQGSPDAFWAYSNNRALTIDQAYVDGISLTHGRPRKHIWTFAAALHETLIHPRNICPCTNIHNQQTLPIPPYVGIDYFCDTGSSQRFEVRFYPDDPLWDGQGCGRLNTCCSFNNPPWFMKQLPASTHDDIEMRLCTDQARDDEDIVFEILELYVQ
jgi:hypothetical protein